MNDIKEYIEKVLRTYEKERNAAKIRVETNNTMAECYNEFACVLREIITQFEKEVKKDDL